MNASRSTYLHAYEDEDEDEDPKEARTGIGRYLDFDNRDRPHQALGYQTPKAFYEHDVARRSERHRTRAQRNDVGRKTNGASRQDASRSRTLKAA